MFTVDDVKEQVLSFLNQLLMKWIVREGKDMLIFLRMPMILPRDRNGYGHGNATDWHCHYGLCDFQCILSGVGTGND